MARSQPTPLYGPTLWHIVFVLINLVQIRRLLVERRERMLTKEQELVAEQMFRSLSHDELVTLLTHVMYKRPGRLHELPRLSSQELTREERVLKDIAFSRLSRQEVTILLTRRLWNFLKRLNPARWRRESQAPLGM